MSDLTKDADWKEAWKKVHKAYYGTLEETDESYSFEDGFARFTNALQRVCQYVPPPKTKGKKAKKK